MKITNIFKKNKVVLSGDSRPSLQQLVDFAKSNFVDRAVMLLTSKGKSNNPVAIPYTPEAVKKDFTAVRQCMIAEHLTDDELAALLAVAMMKKHPKSILQLLSDSGYSVPPLDRVIYLSTYVSTLRSLADFASTGIKKYKVNSCGDSKVCEKCAKQDGKKHFVDKAIIGKTAPPFCEKCRCIIIAEF